MFKILINYLKTDQMSKVKVMLLPTIFSWCQAPIWDLRPDFYYCQTIACSLIWETSLTIGRVCSLQLLLVLASAAIIESASRGTRNRILLSKILDFLFVASCRPTVEVFDHAPTRGLRTEFLLNNM
jgi:hypothetical protein